MFSKEDYDSNMGINTYIWGPLQWTLLHTISFNYPVNPTENDKDNYHEYLMSLKYVLPCKACRMNYPNNLVVAGYNRNTLRNRDTLSRFIYDLHNVVNVMLGRKKYSTYEIVRDKFELFRAKCVNGVPVIPMHANIKLESGCTLPANNIKTQCMITVIPLDKRIKDTFIIDKKCIPVKSATSNKPKSAKPTTEPRKISKKLSKSKK